MVTCKICKRDVTEEILEKHAISGCQPTKKMLKSLKSQEEYTQTWLSMCDTSPEYLTEMYRRFYHADAAPGAHICRLYFTIAMLKGYRVSGNGDEIVFKVA